MYISKSLHNIKITCLRQELKFIDYYHHKNSQFLMTYGNLLPEFDGIKNVALEISVRVCVCVT